jgi:hypothetical protein
MCCTLLSSRGSSFERPKSASLTQVFPLPRLWTRILAGLMYLDGQLAECGHEGILTHRGLDKESPRIRKAIWRRMRIPPANHSERT